MRMTGIPFFIAYFIIAACVAPKTTGSGANSGSGYNEDLSHLRPKVEEERTDAVVVNDPGKNKTTAYVEPRYSVNEKLDVVLDSIDRINLSRKFVEGYTIQVYSGKREEALNIRKQLASLLPEISSEVQFTEPIFRVKAGKYYQWIEAQGDFALIKKYFPAAIVIPEKIQLAQ